MASASEGGVFAALRRSIAERSGRTQVTLTGSGTEALVRCLEFLKRTRSISTVYLACYTCPELVTAIVAAGVRAHPLPVDEKTLEIDFTNFPRDASGAIILSNLYGLVDRLPQGFSNLSVIDDACQAFLSQRNDHGAIVGGVKSTLGVLSFGRGKGLCGIGGGAVLGEIHQPADSDTPKESGVERLKYLAMLAFEHPSFYTLLKQAPGLGLGKTVYHREFVRHGFGNVAGQVALAALLQAETQRSTFISNARLWNRALAGSGVCEPFVARGLSFTGEVAPIRYPILLPTQQMRDRALELLTHAGLGASGSYPASIQELCRGESQLVMTDSKSGDVVSKRIITLPVHRFVQKNDIEVGAEIISVVTRSA